MYKNIYGENLVQNPSRILTKQNGYVTQGWEVLMDSFCSIWLFRIGEHGVIRLMGAQLGVKVGLVKNSHI